MESKSELETQGEEGETVDGLKRLGCTWWGRLGLGELVDMTLNAVV